MIVLNISLSILCFFLQRYDFYSAAQNKIHFFYSVIANKQDWLFIVLLFDNFSFDSRKVSITLRSFFVHPFIWGRAVDLPL